MKKTMELDIPKYLKTLPYGPHSRISLHNVNDSYKSWKKRRDWTLQNILKSHFTIRICIFPCSMQGILVNHRRNCEVEHSKIFDTSLCGSYSSIFGYRQRILFFHVVTVQRFVTFYSFPCVFMTFLQGNNSC